MTWAYTPVNPFHYSAHVTLSPEVHAPAFQFPSPLVHDKARAYFSATYLKGQRIIAAMTGYQKDVVDANQAHDEAARGDDGDDDLEEDEDTDDGDDSYKNGDDGDDGADGGDEGGGGGSENSDDCGDEDGGEGFEDGDDGGDEGRGGGSGDHDYSNDVYIPHGDYVTDQICILC